MLININPILNPELLYHLRAMGHGDKLVLTDANFPAYSHSLNNKVIRLDGVDIYEAVEAAATKPFGFTPYFPGPGIGGHCIPIDPISSGKAL